MDIKRGDTVEVISGDDKGIRGTVRAVLPKEDKVVVSGVNIIRKHQRPTRDTSAQVGIIEMEAPLHVSNVALVCPHCDRPTRVGHEVLDDGTKSRVCRKCGELVE